MTRLDETPLDPEVLAALDAIDATLAGEPVDPEHAELAELALLLADQRPRSEPAFAAALDERVERRFTRARRARRPSRWAWAPAAGLVVAATVAIVIATGSGGGSVRAAKGFVLAPAPATRSSSAAGTSATASSAAGPVASVASPQPAPTARKTIQAAQLALSTSPGRVGTVAQEVFDVVGRENGIVSSSSVTSGSPSGYAEFQLSIPSGSLGPTMAALSTLPYARVSSRTDTTQDVNDQYQADVRALADARALRTSLLRQLANATTQSQIDSLTARIHDAEASISSDEATLRTLSHQVNFSRVTLTVNAGSAPVGPSPGGGGFTLRKAAHDAGRVLTVAAGVVLIAAAALLPLALIAALAWWIATLARRRRREQALDAI